MVRNTLRLLVTALLIATTLMVASCDSGGLPTSPELGPQPASTVYKGQVIDQLDPNEPLSYRIISSSAEFEEAWSQLGVSGATPSIDFSRQQVIVASGIFSLGCEILNIDRVIYEQRGINLDVTVGREGPCVCLAAVSYFAHVISLPRFNGGPNVTISESPQQPQCPG